MTRRTLLAVFTLGLLLSVSPAFAADKLKALIIDGQNNHDWKGCQPVLKWILEDCGRFTVDIATTPPSMPGQPRALPADANDQQKAEYQKAMGDWNAQKARIAEDWKAWHPKFSDYSVIVSNYNGDAWPEAVRKDFEQYMQNGGGLVIVHAADNSFPEWKEFNEMIAVGGWGGRNEKSGPMVRWRDGKIVFDNTPGGGGMHGAQEEFVVETRDAGHPIMKGLPQRWTHATDELYSKLRGPAKNLTVLATAHSNEKKGGSGEEEPILMVINYGKGRVFHTVLGHGPAAMTGLGFQVTLQRGTEWAATGNVTLPAPKAEDLPEGKAAIRKPTLDK